MTTEIVCTIIASITGIITSVLAIYLTRIESKNAKRSERRQQEALLSLEMVSATLELTEATANAVLGKTNNGNVEKAYTKTENAKAAYVEFQRRVMSEEIV